MVEYGAIHYAMKRRRRIAPIIIHLLLAVTQQQQTCGFVLLPADGVFRRATSDCRTNDAFVAWGLSTERRRRQRRRQRRQGTNGDDASSNSPAPKQLYETKKSPLPTMSSRLLVSLASSQLELLVHSLAPHVKSAALYLPQENSATGQLEFLPAVVHDSLEKNNPKRIFIASDDNNYLQLSSSPLHLGLALPGFQHATSLLPHYPMVDTSSSFADPSLATVGRVEEVSTTGTIPSGSSSSSSSSSSSGSMALSVPLFIGSLTVGVLMVWPSTTTTKTTGWTDMEKEQVERAGHSLALALAMDAERTRSEQTIGTLQESLSNQLHQVKNPLQALRTFGKLLQQRIAASPPSSSSSDNNNDHTTDVSQLLALAQHLMVQSDRVVDLLQPMDSLVLALEPGDSSFDPAPSLLNPAAGRLASPSPNMWTSNNTPPKQQQSTPRYRQGSDDTKAPPMVQTWTRSSSPSSTRPAATTVPAPRGTFGNNGTRSSDPRPASSMSNYSPVSNRTDPNGIWVFERTPSSSINDTDFTLRSKPKPQHFSRPQQSDTRPSSPPPPPAMMRTEWERTTPSPSTHATNVVTNKGPPMGDDSTLEMAFVPDVLEPILTACKAVAMDRGVVFQILPDEQGSDLPGVRICPTALQEAIANLLDNAIKYVILGDSNAPTVSLTWRPNHGNSPLEHNLLEQDGTDEPAAGVTIWIHDNGPGIPIQERAAIFQRGYRATNARERLPGSGIGLDISKSLITSMGGRLELATTAGGGTTMQITLFRDPNNL